ncbi:MAG: NAD-binding protein [Treponema sp.]|nr:NAD-binding protein [Treponema sp.]
MTVCCQCLIVDEREKHIELHIKDLQNALDTAHNLRVPIPLTAEVMEIFQGLRNDGYAANDHSAIVRHYEKLAKIEVRK